jgi:putative ABC transport system permease protein
MAEQRTKEIGVRKVLGASSGSIVALLSKDFTRLVGIALVVALPAAYFAMNRWLQQFAYRVDIPWWVFALSGVAVVLIALLTVSYQAIRAATTNPARALRYE